MVENEQVISYHQMKLPETVSSIQPSVAFAEKWKTFTTSFVIRVHNEEPIWHSCWKERIPNWSSPRRYWCFPRNAMLLGVRNRTTDITIIQRLYDHLLQSSFWNKQEYRNLFTVENDYTITHSFARDIEIGIVNAAVLKRTLEKWKLYDVNLNKACYLIQSLQIILYLVTKSLFSSKPIY